MKKNSYNIILCLFAAILLTSSLPTMLYSNQENYKDLDNVNGFGHPVIKTAEALEQNPVNEVGILQTNDESSKTHEATIQVEQLATGQFAYKMLEHIVNDGNGEQDLTDRYSDNATIPGPSIEINKGDSLILKSISLNGEEEELFIEEAEEIGSIEYSAADSTRELGLFGAIIVHPNSDNNDDAGIENVVANGDQIQTVNQDDIKKQFVLFMVGSTFWGMEIDENHIQTPLWTNPTLGADLRDLVQFHVLGSGHDHTFHLHAHRWIDPGTTEIIDVKEIQPGDTHDFTVIAGDFVGAGDWQYHCHVFAHMEAGMMGIFKVGPVESSTQSIPGASPEDEGSPSTITEKNFMTFRVTDEPGTWFNNVANLDSLISTLGGSLGIINPGGTVHFVMTDTNTVHSITSLLWPKDAANMPFDQMTGYKGGAIVQLENPGLYVFTCKIHPYMFAGTIVDDPETTAPDGSAAYDIGEVLQLANGVELQTDPTSNDPTFGIFTSLVRTFFKITNLDNWKDYREKTHVTELPPVPVLLGGGHIVPLDALNTVSNTEKLKDPKIPGIGEVWVDTQFEITEGKSKPGTATRVNTATWDVERKVSLPEINMNHPHNMWTDENQEIIYQTMWFDDRLAVFDRETGTLIDEIIVGDSPSHVITNPLNDLAYIANNGEQGVAEVNITNVDDPLLRIIPMQKSGQNPTHPHGHWISADGTKMVTPNALTADSTIYDFFENEIQRTIGSNGEDTSTGAIPIATSIRPQGDKYYVANLLDSTLSVVDLNNGQLIKNINLLAPLFDTDPNNDGTTHALPIQTPTSPDGKFVVTANTLTSSISVVDTDIDEVVASLPCDPGCHGANFGFKDLSNVKASDLENVYPYYAYVASKFSNGLIVVDPDPNNDGDGSDAEIAGRILLTEDNKPKPPKTLQIDDEIVALEGTGGQGVLAIPIPYYGWVCNTPPQYIDLLTPQQKNLFPDICETIEQNKFSP